MIKTTLRSLFLQIVIVAAVVGGLSFNVPGLANLAAFAIWFVILPLQAVALISLFEAEDKGEEVASPPANPVLYLKRGLALGTVAVLAWHGWLFTAAAMLLAMMLGMAWTMKAREVLEQRAREALADAAQL